MRSYFLTISSDQSVRALLSDLQIMRDPTRTIFFLQSNVDALLNIFWTPQYLRLTQSHDRSHNNYRTASMVSRTIPYFERS